MRCRFAAWVSTPSVDPTEGDLFLVENYRTRGAFGEAI